MLRQHGQRLAGTIGIANKPHGAGEFHKRIRCARIIGIFADHLQICLAGFSIGFLLEESFRQPVLRLACLRVVREPIQKGPESLFGPGIIEFEEAGLRRRKERSGLTGQFAGAQRAERALIAGIAAGFIACCLRLFRPGRLAGLGAFGRAGSEEARAPAVSRGSPPSSTAPLASPSI